MHTLKQLASAAASNFPNMSFSVWTSFSTGSVVVSLVKLQMSEKRMLTFSCFSTMGSLKGGKRERARRIKKGEGAMWPADSNGGFA